MNEKTAKLLNAVALATGAKSLEIKRTWHRVPGPKRHRLRRQFRDIVAAAKTKAKAS